MKKASKEQIMAMARNADAKEYNRRVVTELLEVDLDPDGTSLVAPFLFFHNDQGHHRCQCYLKVINSMEPVVVWLDVDSEYYDKLEDAPNA